MEKPTEKRGPSNVAVHIRLDANLVAWVDKEARRQRRARAYVIAKAVQMMKAVFDHMQQEEGT